MPDPNMPDPGVTRLVARSAFGALPRSGKPDAGVLATERDGLALATILARKGQGAALRERVRALHGLDLPDGPRVASSGRLSIVGTGPGAWLAVAEGEALVAGLARDLAGLASVADQSGGTAILALSGPNVRDAMAKGFTIDLHPSRFPPGAAAVTQAAHIGVVLWRAPDDDAAAPTFQAAIARSYAADFWHWLSDSAAQYGFGSA